MVKLNRLSDLTLRNILRQACPVNNGRDVPLLLFILDCVKTYLRTPDLISEEMTDKVCVS